MPWSEWQEPIEQERSDVAYQNIVVSRGWDEHVGGNTHLSVALARFPTYDVDYWADVSAIECTWRWTGARGMIGGYGFFNGVCEPIETGSGIGYQTSPAYYMGYRYTYYAGDPGVPQDHEYDWQVGGGSIGYYLWQDSIGSSGTALQEPTVLAEALAPPGAMVSFEDALDGPTLKQVVIRVESQVVEDPSWISDLTLGVYLAPPGDLSADSWLGGGYGYPPSTFQGIMLGSITSTGTTDFTLDEAALAPYGLDFNDLNNVAWADFRVFLVPLVLFGPEPGEMALSDADYSTTHYTPAVRVTVIGTWASERWRYFTGGCGGAMYGWGSPITGQMGSGWVPQEEATAILDYNNTNLSFAASMESNRWDGSVEDPVTFYTNPLDVWQYDFPTINGSSAWVYDPREPGYASGSEIRYAVYRPGETTSGYFFQGSGTYGFGAYRWDHHKHAAISGYMLDWNRVDGAVGDYALDAYLNNPDAVGFEIEGFYSYREGVGYYGDFTKRATVLGVQLEIGVITPTYDLDDWGVADATVPTWPEFAVYFLDASGFVVDDTYYPKWPHPPAGFTLESLVEATPQTGTWNTEQRSLVVDVPQSYWPDFTTPNYPGFDDYDPGTYFGFTVIPAPGSFVPQQPGNGTVPGAGEVGHTWSSSVTSVRWRYTYQMPRWRLLC